MEDIHYIPVPFFILDVKLNILDTSDEGRQLQHGESFLEIIEEESSTKFSKYFHRNASGIIEINIKSKEYENTPQLVDVYFRFVENKQQYYVALISKAENYSDISKKLEQIQKQLWNPNRDDSFQKQLHPSSFHLDTAADRIRQQETHIQEAVEELKQLKADMERSLPEQKVQLLKKCTSIEKILLSSIKSH